MNSFFKPTATATSTAASKDSSAHKENQPWVEKYRPKDMSQVSSQDETIQVLRNTAASNNLPHLLFYGPAGTGKTSTILALAREVYGPEGMKSRVLELNASDERGISVVRDKIKNFARTTISQQGVKPGCPPFKLIILDEADSMTNDAQSALRRTMETYSNITRFCLICNYVSRIIEPLASRCAKFRFKPLESGSAINRMEYIAQAESVPCSRETLMRMVTIAEGDLRKAITFLQSAHRLQGAHADAKEITAELVYDIAGVVPESVVDQFLAVCQSNNAQQLEKMVRNVIMDGYSGSQLLSQLHDHIVRSESMSAKQKSLLMQKLASVEKNLVDGSDEQLHLLDFAMKAGQVLAVQ